jgi:hypothetical protein
MLRDYGKDADISARARITRYAIAALVIAAGIIGLGGPTLVVSTDVSSQVSEKPLSANYLTCIEQVKTASRIQLRNVNSSFDATPTDHYVLKVELVPPEPMERFYRDRFCYARHLLVEAKVSPQDEWHKMYLFNPGGRSGKPFVYAYAYTAACQRQIAVTYRLSWVPEGAGEFCPDCPDGPLMPSFIPPSPTTANITINRSTLYAIVTPSSGSMCASTSQEVSANARDASGCPVAAVFGWRSSAPQTATVVNGPSPGTGLVQAVDSVPTPVTVMVTALPIGGGRPGRAPIQVLSNAPTSVTVTPEKPEMCTYDTQTVRADVQCSNGCEPSGLVTWSVTPSGILDVSADGRVTPQAAGLATVQATAPNGGSGIAPIEVLPNSSLTSLTVEGPSEVTIAPGVKQVYTAVLHGSNACPRVENVCDIKWSKDPWGANAVFGGDPDNMCPQTSLKNNGQRILVEFPGPVGGANTITAKHPDTSVEGSLRVTVD